MSREYIAKTLKRLRETSGFTADEVGKIVGKSGKTVNAWENNRGQPDAEMLMLLCDIYKVDNILAEFKPNINCLNQQEEQSDNTINGIEPIYEENKDPLTEEITKLYATLNDENKKYLYGYIQRLLEEQNKE